MAIEANDVEWDDVGEGEASGTFVWDRDARRQMVRGAAKPSNKKVPKDLLSKPVSSSYFAEIGDVGVPANDVNLDADLYKDPDFLATSGHFDRDGLEDIAAEAGMVEEMTLDPVANVVAQLNQRMDMNTFLSVVVGSDATGKVNDVSAGDLAFPDKELGRKTVPTVEVPRAGFNLLLAVAESAVGVSRDGTIRRRQDTAKKSPDAGDSASV